MPSIGNIFLIAGAALSGIILVLGLRSALWDSLFLAGIGVFLAGILLNYITRKPPGRSTEAVRGGFSGTLSANVARD
jgi:hypothetical protein